MNKEIEEQGRRITVILDPHIKVSEDYFAYKEGMELQYQEKDEDLTNIFVRMDRTSNRPFYGDCWPGNSTWVDFLNEHGQNFWGGLYAYDKFKGSNYLYSAWNDMNEPSIFDSNKVS